MQKSSLLILLVLTASTSFVLPSSFAAEKGKKSASREKVVTETEAEKSAPKTSSYSTDANLSVTGSIGAIDGGFAFGPGAQLEWPVILEGNSFAFGFQTGFYHTKNTETVMSIEASSKGWAIPLLVTGKYNFGSDIAFIRPYLALGLGLSVDHGSGEVVVSGVKQSKSDTSVHFAMLFRPGATLGNEQAWFVELPMGVLLNEFAILPSVGYHF